MSDTPRSTKVWLVSLFALAVLAWLLSGPEFMVWIGPLVTTGSVLAAFVLILVSWWRHG